MPHRTSGTNRGVSRRRFLTATGLGAAALATAPLLGRPRPILGANEKLSIGVIGVANRGNANLNGVAHEHIAALCDVDARYLGAAHQQFGKARTFADYRRMLDAKAGELDAVVVSTSDHVHATATARALREGLHVYCEKPLTHTVHEARVVSSLAAKHGAVTQMGTQIHAGENYRRVVELIRSGAIGEVREVDVWCRKAWSDGRYRPGANAPEHLDWDLWLGPAAKRGYLEQVHPANWRRFWDFGGGTLSDMACHYLDLVTWALDLKGPNTISAEGPPVHPVGTPNQLTVTWEFPTSHAGHPVTLRWFDGGPVPDRLESALQTATDAQGQPLSWGDGHLFVGTKGMLLSDYGRHLLLPANAFKDFQAPPQSIARSIGHHREWTEACKGNGTTTCDFGYAGNLTEIVLLGIVAYRAGTTIYWDADAGRVTNDPLADTLLTKMYRPGWEL